jgi:hypothetical protein
MPTAVLAAITEPTASPVEKSELDVALGRSSGRSTTTAAL